MTKGYKSLNQSWTGKWLTNIFAWKIELNNWRVAPPFFHIKVYLQVMGRIIIEYVQKGE